MELARQTAELKAQLAVSKQMQAIELEEIQIKQKRSEFENKVKLATLTEEAKLLTTTEDKSQVRTHHLLSLMISKIVSTLKYI